VRVPRVDGRENGGVVRMVAEAEALGADNLRRIVTSALDRLLVARKLEPLVAVRGRERDERRAIRELLA
jgi:hypothetical protein